MPASVHRTLADGMTILGLPRKIGNTNTSLDRKVVGLAMMLGRKVLSQNDL